MFAKNQKWLEGINETKEELTNLFIIVALYTCALIKQQWNIFRDKYECAVVSVMMKAVGIILINDNRNKQMREGQPLTFLRDSSYFL